MLLDHIYKGRTAGGRHLLSLFVGLCPLLCLISCRHIAAQSHFNHVCKAQLL